MKRIITLLISFVCFLNATQASLFTQKQRETIRRKAAKYYGVPRVQYKKKYEPKSGVSFTPLQTPVITPVPSIDIDDQEYHLDALSYANNNGVDSDDDEFLRDCVATGREELKKKWYNPLSWFSVTGLTTGRQSQFGFAKKGRDKKLESFSGFMAELGEFVVIRPFSYVHEGSVYLLSGKDAAHKVRQNYNQRIIDDAAYWLGYDVSTVGKVIAAAAAVTAAITAAAAAIGAGLSTPAAIGSFIFGAAGAAPAIAAAYYAAKAAAPYIGVPWAIGLGIAVFIAMYLGIYKLIIRKVIDHFGDKKRKAADKKKVEEAKKVDLKSDTIAAVKALFKPILEQQKPTRKGDVKKSSNKRLYAILGALSIAFVAAATAAYCAQGDEPVNEQLFTIDQVDQDDRYAAKEYVELAIHEREQANYRMRTQMMMNDARSIHKEAVEVEIDRELDNPLLDAQTGSELLGDKRKLYGVDLSAMRAKLDSNNDTVDIE